MEQNRKIGFTLGETSQVSMCQSCADNQSPDVESAFGRQRMRSQSTCESLISSPYQDMNKQYQDIVLSYHKLKISFTVMLILNAILLVVVITCMVFIIPHISTDKDIESHPKESISVMVPTPKTEPLQEHPKPNRRTSGEGALREDGADLVKCKIINDTLGAVYKNGQKINKIVGQMCSMGDMIESVVKVIYLKIMLQWECIS